MPILNEKGVRRLRFIGDLVNASISEHPSEALDKGYKAKTMLLKSGLSRMGWLWYKRFPFIPQYFTLHLGSGSRFYPLLV